MARYDSGGIEVVSGTAADVLEEAKVISESMWVVRHAMCCKNPVCEVAGCAGAKLVLRVIDEQDKGMVHKDLSHGLFAACDFVRSVVEHASTCAWARGARDDQRDRAPCLLCALVSRARPQRDHQGRLRKRLDFSKRSPRGDDIPNFSLPAPTIDDYPELARSNTTEELAMLLSDLSRHSTKGPLGKRRRSYPPNTQEQRAPTTTTAYQNESTEDEDAADQSSLPPLPPPSHRYPSSSAPPPHAENSFVKVAQIHSRNQSHQYPHHHHHHLLPPPPKKQFPLAALRVATHGPSASLVPRSPSFSAAASSLLALTGGIVPGSKSAAAASAGQPSVVKQHQRTLLVPQC